MKIHELFYVSWEGMCILNYGMKIRVVAGTNFTTTHSLIPSIRICLVDLLT